MKTQSVTVRMPIHVHDGYHTLKVRRMGETKDEVSKNDLYVIALAEYLKREGVNTDDV